MKATNKQILRAVKLIDEEHEIFSCIALSSKSYNTKNQLSKILHYSEFFGKESKSNWFGYDRNSKNERMTALLLYMVAREDVLGG